MTEAESAATILWLMPPRWGSKVAAVKGPGLRRSPQGDAERHRRVHRRLVIADDLGIKFASLTIAMLGRATNVSISKQNTAMVGGPVLPLS